MTVQQEACWGLRVSTTTMNIHSHSKYLHSCSKRTCIFLLPMHSQFSAQVSRTETHNTPWKCPSYEGSRTGPHSHSKAAWTADPGNVLKPRLLKLNSEKSLWFILTMDTSCFWFHWEHPTSLPWSLIHRRIATRKYLIQADTQASEMQGYQSLQPIISRKSIKQWQADGAIATKNLEHPWKFTSCECK